MKVEENVSERKRRDPGCAALGAEGAKSIFYRVPPGQDVPERCDRLGSFSWDVITSHKNIFPDIEHHIVEQDVRILSFDVLVQEFNVEAIDLNMIDTEGYDYEILKQINFQRFLPAIVIYEQFHLDAKTKSQSRILLEEAGYRVHAPNSMDCVAIQQSR